jgi:hypothetical protein
MAKEKKGPYTHPTIPRCDATGLRDYGSGRGLTSGMLAHMPVEESLLREVRERVAELDAQKKAEVASKK